MKKLLLIAAAVALLTPAALAHDLNPPPWRGDPGSTFQHWTFDAPPPNPAQIAPEIEGNPFGDPVIYDEYDTSSEWLPGEGAHEGLYHFYWDFYIDLPNDPTPRPAKDIVIQFTYYYDGTTGWDNGRPVPSVYWPEAPHTNSVAVVQEYPLPEANWWYSEWAIHIEPNPDFESIYVVADDDYSELIFDQIVVDTRCYPEPTTLALLGFGALAIIRRR